MDLLPWFLSILAFALLLVMLVTQSKRETKPFKTEQKSTGRSTGNRTTRVALPSGQVQSLKRGSKNKKATVRERLIQAGLYRDGFVSALLVLRFVLLGLFALGGYLLFEFGFTSLAKGLFLGVTSGLAATIVPVVMLDYLKSRRQTGMRRALPDALDVIVICMEGGLSLPAAFSKVSRELVDIHPILSGELRIVEREVQMGMSLGEALRNLAGRFDLEELRGLAMVVSQSDRFGSSVSRSFKVFAQGMRLRRQQKAEEMAHKAAVKMLLPCALLIFPAMFVVTLAPAVFRAVEVLQPLLEDVDLEIVE